jgi:hypothetical protein
LANKYSASQTSCASSSEAVFGTIERVVRERDRRAALVIDRHNLKCWPAAIDHGKTGSLAHTLDDVGKCRSQAFRIDRNIHTDSLDGSLKLTIVDGPSVNESQTLIIGIAV